jgi:adenylylsulfate kinase
MDAQQSPGFVIWLTGMNRAGKSTLAARIAARLEATGRPIDLLDENGDAALLLEGLGASKEDHARAVQRLGFVAKAVAGAGGIAVCAALSPNRDVRETLRREARRFFEIFVDCSMEKLQQRDPQGIYRRALAGELKQVPGIDVPYEPPARPELTVHSDQLSVDDAAAAVFQALVDQKLLSPADFVRISGGQRPKRAKPARTARAGARRKLAGKAAARQAPKKPKARTARSARPPKRHR